MIKKIARSTGLLEHTGTYKMAAGTHRPEILYSEEENKLILIIVEHDEEVKHKGYVFDADDIENIDFENAEGFAVTTDTEEYGGPADHRTTVVDDEIIVIYQTNISSDEPCEDPSNIAEACSLEQSLLISKFNLEGEELFSGEIVAHVPAEDFDTDNFPDHSLVWNGEYLLVSTGSRGEIISFREIDIEDGSVLNTYRYTAIDYDVANIGNSLLFFDEEHYLISAIPTEDGLMTISKLADDYEPLEQMYAGKEDDRKQNFTTGVLHLDEGYTLVGYYSWSEEKEGALTSEENDHYPYLKIFDEDWNIVYDEMVGDGTLGFSGVHPTITRIGDKIYYSWSSVSEEEGDVGHMPQVRIEEFELSFD